MRTAACPPKAATRDSRGKNKPRPIQLPFPLADTELIEQTAATDRSGP